ncbi:hypothetical protein [Taibaiella chishuiensis]|uniref:Uncharacterized protein n=1 Tax=Taibaiella chishuiensis TaxID=1434707 RepID=A0A2P8D1H7_9BACT|nr:hypothetical protein [Taibaiella chishuiensis]PSK91067.1 hypothetical protein B0I18_10677 [Taibaiella chishuiensis]
MFNLFSNNRKETVPEWVAGLEETQQRWFAFLEKLEARMEELCTAAIPELKEMLAADEDTYQRTFYKIQSGINGQMQHIRRKAYDTYEEKVINARYAVRDGSLTGMGSDYLTGFTQACSDRYHRDFESKFNYWQGQLDQAAVKDYEAEYRRILSDFEQTKNSFACSQCGSPLTIDRIFFISTYITCPACKTQNTFEPGTSARSLQHIARSLAEQRTRHLLAAYEAENELERELYQANHELKLSLIFEKDRTVTAGKEQQIRANEIRRQEAISNAPRMYKAYLRAMYDEWNNITPDLKEHNEKMYLRHIASNHFPS